MIVYSVSKSDITLTLKYRTFTNFIKTNNNGK